MQVSLILVVRYPYTIIDNIQAHVRLNKFHHLICECACAHNASGFGISCQAVHTPFALDKNGILYVPRFRISSSSSICLVPKTNETRRSVEHCTPHADCAGLNELGWSQL